jgi:hypothetical protein
MDEVPISNRAELDLSMLGPLGTTHQAIWRALKSQQHLPPSALRACCERLAVLHGLSSVRTTPRDAGEAAVLEFTEIYAQDPGALTDELAAAVRAHYGDAGLVALVEALGLCDARLRLERLLPQILPGGVS